MATIVTDACNFNNIDCDLFAHVTWLAVWATPEQGVARNKTINIALTEKKWHDAVRLCVDTHRRLLFGLGRQLRRNFKVYDTALQFCAFDWLKERLDMCGLLPVYNDVRVEDNLFALINAANEWRAVSTNPTGSFSSLSPITRRHFFDIGYERYEIGKFGENIIMLDEQYPARTNKVASWILIKMNSMSQKQRHANIVAIRRAKDNIENHFSKLYNKDAYTSYLIMVMTKLETPTEQKIENVKNCKRKRDVEMCLNDLKRKKLSN